MVTINIGPCDCCGCDCNCTLELTAFANGNCGGGSSFRVYLKVDDGPVEVAGPEAYPIIEKSFTDGPHEICMWWNESDLDSNDGESRNIPFFWFGNLELEIDGEDTAETQVCLSSCNIPDGSSINYVQIILYMHQNESGTEDSEIHLTELRLCSGLWESDNLLVSPVLVRDFTDHPSDTHLTTAGPVTGLTPDRANSLCLCLTFENEAGTPATVKLHQAEVTIDFESAAGASPGAFGGVFITRDFAEENPCPFTACGNPASLSNRLCPGDHAPDDVEDQSSYTPSSCFTIDCECPPVE